MTKKRMWKCVSTRFEKKSPKLLKLFLLSSFILFSSSVKNASAQYATTGAAQNDAKTGSQSTGTSDQDAPSGIQPVYPGEPLSKAPIEATIGPAKIRLYGTLLMNISTSDSDEVGQDVPLWPFPSSLSVTYPDGTTQRDGLVHDTVFTARQSVFGMVVSQAQPSSSGWNSSALVEFDFFGTSPVDTNLPEDRVLNQPRLRLAYFQLQKGDFKLIAGQDRIIISPLDPISLSHVAYPLGYSAGDLFGWLPQLRVEYNHSIGDTNILFQAGILRPTFGDARLGDQPPVNITVNTTSGLGERASQPFYQARLAASHPMNKSKATVGLGGHYGRERLGAHRTEDSWAFTVAASVPILPKLALRGEAYVGSNLVPFGGGVLQGVSAIPNTTPFTRFNKVGDVGGWPELTFFATAKDVFYAGMSVDEPVRHDLLPGSIRTKNAVFWGSYFRKLTPGTTVAVEYSNWDFHTTGFTGTVPGPRAATGRGNVVNIAFAYQF